MSDKIYTLDDILKEYNSDKVSAANKSGRVMDIKEPKYTAVSPKAAEPMADVQKPRTAQSVRTQTAQSVQPQNTKMPQKAEKPDAPRNAAPVPVKQPLSGEGRSAVTQQKKAAPIEKRTHSGGKKSKLSQMAERYWFLFKQLVKRDFKSRYKRAALGVIWSMLSPMLTFASQAIIFSVLFSRNVNHYISYLVIGNVVFHFFTDAANQGMFSLVANGSIISKIKVPKTIFLFSKNVSCLLNFGLTMIIMFVICLVDGVTPGIEYLSLIFPILCLVVFNLGVGYLLSAAFVFFKDTQYLFGLFTQVLMYFSAIFYEVTRFPENLRKLFYVNPVYCYIDYFRTVIISNTIPDLKLHMLCIFYALIVCLLGIAVYRKNSNKFVYYF